MTTIERTAFPRFRMNKPLSKKELREFFTPTTQEINMAWSEGGRKKENVFIMLLQLKAIQRLGYFPNQDDIPKAIVSHIRKYMGFSKEINHQYTNKKTLYRHRGLIRKFLKIKPWNGEAQRFVSAEIYEHAQTINYSADLINIGVELLIKENYELPAFSTIHRLVRHTRYVVNGKIYGKITQNTSAELVQRIESLFKSDHDSIFTDWQKIKELPRKPTLTHLKAILDHLKWLMTFGKMNSFVENIPEAKWKYFAAIGKATRAKDMRDLEKAKRLCVAICMIYKAQVDTRDSIITMFIKRMASFHSKAKIELDILREKNAEE